MQLFKKLTLVILFVALATPAWAADFSIITATQAEFDALVQDAARLTAYRSMAPAEPGGLTGFEVGVSVSGIEIDGALWDQYIGEDEDVMAVPRLMVRKGLPFNIDVGAFYSEVDDYDISLYGGELQVALLEGSVATPAVALRGSYTKLDAADEMEVETVAADLVVSKGFAMLTPYAGIGIVDYEGEYTGALPIVLQKYDDDETRYFAGVRFALTALQIAFEYEQMDEPVYSLKIAAGF